MVERIDLTAVFFREHGAWIGHIVERDICASAITRDEMELRLFDTLAVELDESLKRHGKPFAGIDPAPSRFAEAYREGSDPVGEPRRMKLVSRGFSINVQFRLVAALRRAHDAVFEDRDPEGEG